MIAKTASRRNLQPQETKNTMGTPRYSLRALIIALTLVVFAAAGVAWFVRTYGPVTISEATAEMANRALRGYATVPANATDVSVRYTPESCATIKFRLSEREMRAWCEENQWEIGHEEISRYSTRFEFTTPRGGGSWFDGKVVFILISE